jgi:hydroxymethylglutaryl-CoA reductase
MGMNIINGFSKLTRDEKLDWIEKQGNLSRQSKALLNEHLHPRSDLQEIYGDLSENTVSNYILPLGLAPNFLINGTLRTLPMVTEESSVVAAASAAAKFWALHGGFITRVNGTTKVGQVHFTWTGNAEELQGFFKQRQEELIRGVKSLTRNMEQRGGGIESISLQSSGNQLPEHYHLFINFQTAEAMGANFINSVLEHMASQLKTLVQTSGLKGELEILLAILSNYTPECLVECFVEGETAIFEDMSRDLSADQFAQRFQKATYIARYDPYRAVTHNKGIFNGMDAVVLATGNDFRAVEACGHAYAARHGLYSGLSQVELSQDSFRFTLEVPIAVGTVGGLTGTHPLAAASMEILGNPSAIELMQIIAAAGLANNFSALRSLVTTGIQKGHMKMHLGNILRQLNASTQEQKLAVDYFSGKTVSFSEVSSYLDSLRDQNKEK